MNYGYVKAACLGESKYSSDLVRKSVVPTRQNYKKQSRPIGLRCGSDWMVDVDLLSNYAPLPNGRTLSTSQMPLREGKSEKANQV